MYYINLSSLNERGL